MTHIESHDLLLDFAYGELPAHVAAEVSEHLQGCAECQAESAQMDGVRKAFAPIRESEEPSAGFDDSILAAARAEALLEHDGNIGQVIEGAGSFSAPSLAAASVDAHAAPVATPARRRPKWMTRAIVGGSAATAAALALVVGISQPAHREQRPAEEYAIRVAPAAAPPAPAAAAPAPAAQAEARQDAPRTASQDPDALDKAVPAVSSGQADLLQRAKGQPARQQRAELPKKKSSQRAVDQGSGGDVPTPQQLALRDARQEGAGAGASTSSAAPPPAMEKEVPALDAQNVVVTGSSVRRRDAVKDEASGDISTSAKDEQRGEAVAAESAPPAPASPAKMATAARVSKAAVPTPEDPADLEHRAEAARHEGNYALAAGLYREAATGHNYNSGAAAWDLAHAVECLAAGGSFEEARKVRDQLGKLFPTEINAFAAARRALREVDATPSK